MANAIWPAGLPQYVLQQGFRESLGDARIETAMEAGKPKTRRRYTAVPRQISVTLACDLSQRATLNSFYETTTKHGTLPFDWVDPVTQAPKTFLFRGPPVRWGVSGEKHIAQFVLETVL